MLGRAVAFVYTVPILVGERKFCAKFISCRDGPENVLKHGRNENTRLPCYAKLEEKKDKKATF